MHTHICTYINFFSQRDHIINTHSASPALFSHEMSWRTSSVNANRSISFLLTTAKNPVLSDAVYIQYILQYISVALYWASQVALVVKNPPANAGDIREAGLIPGSGRSPGGGHGNPLQDSCLENPVERGAWQATVHGIAKSWTQFKQLSMYVVLYCLDLSSFQGVF